MHLGADVDAERIHQHVEEVGGFLSRVDGRRDLRGESRLIGTTEELDVAERFVEESELLRPSTRAGAHELPPCFCQRHHAGFPPLRVDGAAHAEEPRDELPGDQECSANE